jgi:hypothetical protein
MGATRLLQLTIVSFMEECVSFQQIPFGKPRQSLNADFLGGWSCIIEFSRSITCLRGTDPMRKYAHCATVFMKP